MANTKNNQRYRDTERRMQEAVLELMKNTELSKITVRKICEKAQVNRSTFYAHFVDIYDLLDKMEDELSRQLLERYAGETAGREVFTAASFVPFLQHIKQHQYLYRITLPTRTSFPIARGYERMWEEVIRPCCERAGITQEEEMQYYFVAFQAGFTMMLRRWVEDGCRMEEERMAELLYRAIPHVLRCAE